MQPETLAKIGLVLIVYLEAFVSNLVFFLVIWAAIHFTKTSIKERRGQALDKATLKAHRKKRVLLILYVSLGIALIPAIPKAFTYLEEAIDAKERQ